MKESRAASRALRILVSALALLLAPVAIVLGGAAPAMAHATLVGGSPADGSTVSTPPAKVTLKFDEDIRTPSVVIVTGPDGQRVDHGAVKVVNNVVSIPMAVEGGGRYTVAYRVISADGHPVADETSFTYEGDVVSGRSAAPSPAVPESRAGTNTGWVIGGVAIAVLAAGLLLFTTRRRKPGADGDRSGRGR